jgi:P27 family predicted phage terminase small subunit
MRKPGQGRKPLPTNLKVLRGTDQPCRINKDEPQVPTNRITPPAGLSAVAKKHWKKILPQLRAAKIITNIDATAFAAYCETYATWQHAVDQIAKYGSVIKGEKGFPVCSPYVTIADKTLRQMRDFLTEFGMTPSSRTRIAVTDKPKPQSKFRKLA